MNRCKNSHYKSAVQFNNTATQIVDTTITATTPLTVALGTRVTDTGVSLNMESNAIEVEHSGLYRLSADFNVVGTTAGELTVALTLDGVVLLETIRQFNVVATSERAVHTETVRNLNICCGMENHSIGVIAYSDGTGVGSITEVSGNVIKLA